MRSGLRFDSTVMVMTPTQLAGLPWAGSLGWLEHPADNREVASSNLASPTPLLSSGLPIESAWYSAGGALGLD